MARMSIRIDLGPERRLGPGKVLLLERIAEHGSISAAGRSLKMSYKRAWDLVAELNATFASPLVEAQLGGRHGGGARLTELGKTLVAHYRAIEREAEAASRAHLDALDAALLHVPEQPS
ncbi:winged helix-turn-helix domain-containing protein [Enterovirga aerilata]|uniref:LysR family transcriptional regulator n=1 Tax=Enterovirga aerilata TaxID=2730920 RepID=A0A849I5G7_9HYPH|nr:winged helix-turn-helix domain-containing protein [Enterovirga sp. DB1703]NNM71287.1 LysR family transcriptional regulator [Enterovirga sp. DB1703]